MMTDAEKISAIFAMRGTDRMVLIGFVQNLTLLDSEKAILKEGTNNQLADLLAKYYEFFLKQNSFQKTHPSVTV